MDCRVVVVDDEIMNLTLAKELLSSEGIQVSLLRSGLDLMKFMGKNTPDVILLDIMMPEIDGFQTFHALRKFEEESGRKRTPVIFLTGSYDSEVERRGLNLGAADFIRKPLNKEIMIRRIYNIVSNAKIIDALMDEASVDKLTGFWNRVAGMRRVGKYCKTQKGMLAIMDLDNFKLVNDLYGHDKGDQVLETFAITVRRNIREKDVVARIGGDEFIAFFCNLSAETGLTAMLDRLNAQLVDETTKLLGGTMDIPLGISMGAVKVPDYGRDYGTLFTLADSALYQAKHGGKHNCVMYVDENESEISHEDNLENELERITEIVEERSFNGDALLLGVEQFSVVYRFIKRFYDRYGGTTCRILFVLSSEDNEGLKDAAKQFGECLQNTLRRSDIILQNKVNSFFLFLPEMDEHDISAVKERIMKNWNECFHDDSIRIEYVFKSNLYEKKKFSRNTKTK